AHRQDDVLGCAAASCIDLGRSARSSALPERQEQRAGATQDRNGMERMEKGRSADADAAGLARVLEDVVRCLLADDVERDDDEESRNRGEGGGVDDAEPRRAANPEPTIQDRVRVAILAYRAGTGRVVTPCLVLDEFL